MCTCMTVCLYTCVTLCMCVYMGGGGKSGPEAGRRVHHEKLQ